ncbi:hypothetical protein GMLC_14720 [Geomonas limicola]|uniref:Terminase n=1 Tax=Geomonas limicola TaxID=2740186 RepID=A0A6V8N8Q3_9BACT|nr:phage protein Gp27 family protein [Geomonas limicola]GFO67893.1 hypothetical protein GMLC_14720 [Geomonas limicola]
MGKRSDLEPRAISLYAEGMEIPQISPVLEVSENSLREWKKRAGSEWDEARADFRKGQLASMEDVGRRVQRAREITRQMTGDAASQSAMGQILNESVQSMVYDVMDQIRTSLVDAEEMPKLIKQISNIALILTRTEQAANLNLKLQEEIRKQERERAADAAAKIAKKGGMSVERVNELRNMILGVAA